MGIILGFCKRYTRNYAWLHDRYLWWRLESFGNSDGGWKSRWTDSSLIDYISTWYSQTAAWYTRWWWLGTGGGGGRGWVGWGGRGSYSWIGGSFSYRIGGTRVGCGYRWYRRNGSYGLAWRLNASLSTWAWQILIDSFFLVFVIGHR